MNAVPSAVSRAPAPRATSPGPAAFNRSPLNQYGDRTVFFDEYTALLEAGYVKRGDHLVPPGSDLFDHLPIDESVNLAPRLADFDHAIDGHPNRPMTFGVGGHHPRADNIRIIQRSAPDVNGVTIGQVQIRDPRNGRWLDKRSPTHTFFPDAWTKRQTEFEIEQAFDASRPVEGKPDQWIGWTDDGVPISGYYVDATEPALGWTTAFPIYKPGPGN